MIKKVLLNALFFSLQVSNLNSEIIFTSQTSTFELNGPNAQLVVDTPVTGYTGTLKITDKSAASVTQTTTSDTITFDQGKLEVAGNSGVFTGVYDPASTDTLKLDGNKTLHVDMGTVAEAISVSGTGNKITGSPKLTGGITLADGSTELTLGITSQLESNITLNGGKVILSEDLIMDDNVEISGNGTVDINGKSLLLPLDDSAAWTGNIDFLDANDVTVRKRRDFTGTWTFDGGGSSAIRGWGVILDLTGGGTISALNTHVLDIAGLHIKGLGATGGGDITCAAGATIQFTNCILELAGDYTFSSGTMIFDGGDCKVVVNENEDFIVSGASTILTVDGVVLRYDALGGAVANPFSTASGGTINTINNGAILSTYIPGGGGTTTISGATGTTDSDIQLNSGTTFTIDNAGSTTTFNGNGNAMVFRDTAGTPFVITDNTTVVLENTVLENFDPSQISLGTGAALEFGDGTSMILNKDIEINAIPLTFTGDSTVDGKGSKITLTGSEKLTVTGSNTVKIKDTKLVLNDYDSLKALDDNATFALQNMDVEMTETGASFNSGNITITDDVRIKGSDPTAVPGVGSEFEFISVGNLNIATGSQLLIESGTTFKYEPNITGDAGDPAVEKRHLTFADPSSVLFLNDCIFDTGAHGLIIDHGKIIVDGKADILISSTAGKEFELGNATLLDIMPAAVFNVDGPIKIFASTFP